MPDWCKAPALGEGRQRVRLEVAGVYREALDGLGRVCAAEQLAHAPLGLVLLLGIQGWLKRHGIRATRAPPPGYASGSTEGFAEISTERRAQPSRTGTVAAPND